MRQIYSLIVLVFLSFNGVSQTIKTQPIDTNNICIPYGVAQKILLDLNDYDKLKEVVITYKQEIYQLDSKIYLLKEQNNTWIEDNKLNREIILEKNKAIEIYKTENFDLKKENKRLKTKNGLLGFISAIIITPLTYIAIFK